MNSDEKLDREAIRTYLLRLLREAGYSSDIVEMPGSIFIVTMGGDGDFRGVTTQLSRGQVAKARNSRPSRGYNRRIERLRMFLREHLPSRGHGIAEPLSSEESIALCEAVKKIVPECVCTDAFPEAVAAVERSLELGDTGHEPDFGQRNVWWIAGHRL